jgi:predicted metal-dependent hydrolase
MSSHHPPFTITLEDGRHVICRVRESRRARRVRLTLTPRDGLVLTSPRGVPHAELVALATSWRGWIAKQFEQMGIDDPAQLGVREVRIPDRIELAALGETWHLTRRYAPRSHTQVRRSRTGVLLLSGDCADPEAARRALERWLTRRAREALPGMLERLARETGLRYRNVAVRAQRSRWGSCSSQGDISLNYQVLFLPPELARHVLLHELCHTVRLDHSPRFWRTVERFEPELPRLRAEMRRAWSHVPAWLGPAR